MTSRSERAEQAAFFAACASDLEARGLPSAAHRAVAERRMEQAGLFTPAPEPLPGQTALDAPEGWDG